MSSEQSPAEPLAVELAAALNEVLQVLQSTPVITGGARRRSGASAHVPVIRRRVGLSPQTQLGEMVGRTNIAYTRLERMFGFSSDRPPAHRVVRPLDRAFSHADARRYICAVTLMSRQLLPFLETSFHGVAVPLLRRECGGTLKVPDSHRNLTEELKTKDGFLLVPQGRGHLVYLEPRSGQDNHADLSTRAKSLCAEAVDQLLPFTEPPWPSGGYREPA